MINTNTSQNSPKVFISYSWHPESNKDKVEQLARRLMDDGVFVIIDIWDLHAGMDKNVFMEKMVSDESVNKVLIICNKEYADKANDRQGGVGVESTIMSEEIYSKAEQTKFIPIIFEKDEKGIPYLPIFVKSRIHYDFSDDDVYEKNYEELIRDLHQRPKSQRPALGKMPEFLNEEIPTCLFTSHKVSALKKSIIQNSQNVQILIDDYLATFLEVLKEFKVDCKEVNNDNFILLVEQNIIRMQPLKHDFIQFVNTVSKSRECTGKLFVDFFEKWLQFYVDEDIDLSESDSILGVTNDHYRFFNYDVFLSFAATMLKNAQYETLFKVISSTFYVEEGLYMGGSVTPLRFIEFERFNYTLDHYKNERNGLKRVSVAAEYVCQNAKQIKKETLIQTDILLYYLSLIFPIKSHSYKTLWFPRLGCYNNKLEILPKLISQRYFEQIKSLFGVSTVVGFKQLIENTKEERISAQYYRVPLIKKGLLFDKIGTMD